MSIEWPKHGFSYYVLPRSIRFCHRFLYILVHTSHNELTNDDIFHGYHVTVNRITGVEGEQCVVLIPRIRDAQWHNSFGVNSLRPVDTNMCHGIWSRLVTVIHIACRLYGVKSYHYQCRRIISWDFKKICIEIKYCFKRMCAGRGLHDVGHITQALVCNWATENITTWERYSTP